MKRNESTAWKHTQFAVACVVVEDSSRPLPPLLGSSKNVTGGVILQWKTTWGSKRMKVVSSVGLIHVYLRFHTTRLIQCAFRARHGKFRSVHFSTLDIQHYYRGWNCKCASPTQSLLGLFRISCCISNVKNGINVRIDLRFWLNQSCDNVG